VDDDADSRRVVARFLCECRADVTEAASARQAIDVLSEPSRVDVLVSDIGMPGEDGYSLVRRLRTLESQSGRRSLPAIALTAFARPEDRDRATGAGFNAYLAKPVSPGDLLALIASLVGRAHAPGTTSAPDWEGQPDFGPRE
jgi:CheY-like chemotaxis protein